YVRPNGAIVASVAAGACYATLPTPGSATTIASCRLKTYDAIPDATRQHYMTQRRDSSTRHDNSAQRDARMATTRHEIERQHRRRLPAHQQVRFGTPFALLDPGNIAGLPWGAPLTIAPR